MKPSHDEHDMVVYCRSGGALIADRQPRGGALVQVGVNRYGWEWNSVRLTKRQVRDLVALLGSPK